MVRTGLSEVIGSWKIMAMRLPRMSRICASLERQQIDAVEADRAGHGAAEPVRQQAQHRQRGHALAAAGFADDAERLAGADRERHAVDGPRDAVLGEEVGLEVLDLEQGRGHGSPHMRRAMRGSSRSRSPSPTRLTASTTSASASPGQNTVHGALAR